MSLKDKLNETKNTEGALNEKSQAQQSLEKITRETETQYENNLLRTALMESKANYETLNKQLIQSVNENKQTIASLKEQNKALIEACNKLASNNEQVLEKAIDKQLVGISEKTKKYCQSIEQNTYDATKNFSSWNNYFLYGFFTIVFLLAGNLYLVYSSTSDIEKSQQLLDSTLREEQKYWWDEKNKQLYFNTLEGFKKNQK